MIVFDFDGVIVDSLDLHLGAYREIFNAFKKPVPFASPQIWKEKYHSRWEENFLQNGFSRPELERAISMYSSFVNYDGVKLFPGMIPTLKTLAKKHKLGILSTTPKSVIESYLKKNRIEEYFFAVSGSNSNSCKENRLRELVKEGGTSSERVTMIGDTEADIYAAQAVGTRAVGVTYGWYTEARIRAAKPDLVVHSPEELVAMAQDHLETSAE